MHQILQEAASETIREVRAKLAKAGNSKKRGQDISNDVTLGSLAGIAGIDTYLEDVYSDSGGLYIAQLSVPSQDSLFDRVNERAVEYAKERGAELVSGVDEATRDDIAAIISQGLEDNIGTDAIAQNLQDAYAFSEDRADLIAQTEVSMANGQGVLEGMRGAQNAGVKLKKQWLPDAQACDVCQSNGDDGAIDIDETFASGDDAPPAHPNCECSLASEIEEDTTEEE